MQISNALTSLYAPLPKSSPPINTPPAQAAAAAESPQATGSKGTDAAQAFLDYMKESPAERLQDAWLASHHLTKKDLEAMGPEKRQAVEKQMADEIEAQLKRATENKLRAKTDILV